MDGLSPRPPVSETLKVLRRWVLDATQRRVVVPGLAFSAWPALSGMPSIRGHPFEVLHEDHRRD
jgi:hypothetical protein